MTFRFCVLFFLMLLACPLFAGETAELSITVDGVTPNKGQVFVSLFDQKKEFLRQPLQQLRKTAGDGNSLEFTFEALPTGTYAVSVIHDVDGDGELDTGMFRIPKEPIGVSNNVRSKFGPPKWKKAKFDLENDMHIVIHVAEVMQ